MTNALQETDIDLVDMAQSAERILLPKGREAAPSIDWLRDEAGIDPPDFEGRELTIESDGRTFTKVRGGDIPELLQRGGADIGVTGADSVWEYALQRDIPPVAFGVIGGSMCELVLAAPTDEAEAVKAKLTDGESVRIATSTPNIVGTFAVLKAYQTQITVQPKGGVEAMISLGLADAIVDLSQTGETLRANNLSVIEKITDIPPVLTWSVEEVDRSSQPPPSIVDLSGIVTTLAARVEQIDSDQKSYTLDLLRDPNELTKKLGSESAEFLQEVIADELGKDTGDQMVEEAADLIYAVAVALARSDRDITEPLRILQRRNRSTL